MCIDSSVHSIRFTRLLPDPSPRLRLDHQTQHCRPLLLPPPFNTIKTSLPFQPPIRSTPHYIRSRHRVKRTSIFKCQPIFLSLDYILRKDTPLNLDFSPRCDKGPSRSKPGVGAGFLDLSIHRTSSKHAIMARTKQAARKPTLPHGLASTRSRRLVKVQDSEESGEDEAQSNQAEDMNEEASKDGEKFLDLTQEKIADGEQADALDPPQQMGNSAPAEPRKDSVMSMGNSLPVPAVSNHNPINVESNGGDSLFRKTFGPTIDRSAARAGRPKNETSKPITSKRAADDGDDEPVQRKRRAVGAVESPGGDSGYEEKKSASTSPTSHQSPASSLLSTNTTSLDSALLLTPASFGTERDAGPKVMTLKLPNEPQPRGAMSGKMPDSTDQRQSTSSESVQPDNSTKGPADEVSPELGQNHRSAVVSELPDAIVDQAAPIETVQPRDSIEPLQQDASAPSETIPDPQDKTSIEQKPKASTEVMQPTALPEMQKQDPSAATVMSGESPGALPVDKEEHMHALPADALNQAAKEFREWTASGVSDEVAQQYLTASSGNLQKAVRAYLLAPKDLEPAQENATVEPRPAKDQTLVEEAIAAIAKSKRAGKDIGNVLVVLDGRDLSRSRRILATDLRLASPLFKNDLKSTVETVNVDEDLTTPELAKTVDGVRYLYILKQPINEGGMPTLAYKPLFTMRKDCEHEFYAPPMNPDQLPAPGATNGVKVEAETPEPASNALTGWHKVYHTFLQIIARFPASFENEAINVSLPKIEAIAQIANHHRAVGPRSPITRCLTNLFNHYISQNVLWAAIARDPAVWLMLGLMLENESLYKEAFVHLAGRYPDCQGLVGWRAVPREIVDKVATKSKDLYFARTYVDRLLLTLDNNPLDRRPAALAAKSVWHDWISIYIRIYTHGRGTVTSIQQQTLCNLRQNTLSLNGLYRAISMGGDAYCSDLAARTYWAEGFPGIGLSQGEKRQFAEVLNDMKGEAKRIVDVLVETGLKGGSAELGYLSCVKVEDGDLPWEREGRDGGGESEDEDMEF
ncbi:hypothetical protein TI39_contig355g00003 [Zymoseptoria brevis]|uniref:UBA domain-containing protein n=1 Tax=Zymoseptoria brevis TaxID=1047168 RepID=A0A0F4GQ07_9PEZI|nr:hypothetical protein TI39_contig355g00003 [Zymoseptoria brevis]